MTKKAFELPKWMESYRKYIESGCGGQTVEELLNRKDVNFFNNVILCQMINMCNAKVNLLEQLREDGMLKHD